MGIINNGCIALRRPNGFQSSVYALQGAHHKQNIFCFLSQHSCCTVHSQQIADIKLTDKLYTNLIAIDFEIHSVEMAFQNLCPEISHYTCRIGLNRSLCILHHHHSVLVIGVSDGKSGFRQSIKKSFLGISIVFKGLMIIQMVAG